MVSLKRVPFVFDRNAHRWPFKRATATPLTASFRTNNLSCRHVDETDCEPRRDSFCVRQKTVPLTLTLSFFFRSSQIACLVAFVACLAMAGVLEEERTLCKATRPDHENDVFIGG